MKAVMQQLLSEVGITINGSKPWDIHVHDDQFYTWIARGGEIGAGESYMSGVWDCDALDQMFVRLFRSPRLDQLNQDPALVRALFFARLRSFGQRANAFEIGERHYDLGNDLFQAMLDRRMVYTCGYWSGSPAARTLDAAQEAKLDLTCRKLKLKSGMRVLDIGGGWGGLAKYAAERRGVSVVNITVSKEQIRLADELCRGLPVENRLQDYREVDEPGGYDRVVSLGMFEHVTSPNYRIFMETVMRNLKDDGLFLLHTIGSNQATRRVGWTQKYIFPNSHIPAASQIARAVEGLFVMEDWHNFGADYDKTLMVWHQNFEQHWPTLKERYGETFYRMWRLYLLGFAAVFRARRLQLWQIVFSKSGVPCGYCSVR